MNLKLSLTTMISLGLLASPTLRGAEIKHDLLIIDEGLAQLLRDLPTVRNGPERVSDRS